MKPVNQYNLQGNFIRRWKCTRGVERILGFDHSHISKTCKGKQKTSYNYIWKYAEKELL